MSVYRKNVTNEPQKKQIDDNDKESPLTILKLENNNLNNELKKADNLITKLKVENTKSEQEKALLISNQKKIENNIKELKKQLEQYKKQLTEIKNNEKNTIKIEFKILVINSYALFGKKATKCPNKFPKTL